MEETSEVLSVEDSTSEAQALSGVEPSERSESEPEADHMWQPKRKQLSVKAKYCV